MNELANLLVGPWYMEEQFWQNHINSIMAGLKNPKMFFMGDPKAEKLKKEIKQIELLAKTADSSIGLCHSSRCCEMDSPAIAIYLIQGAITKNSWYYFSTDEFISEFSANDADPNVLGHLLFICSGGGEAAHCDLAASLIQSSQKPKFAMVDSWCCSGGYYYATCCDKIYATSQNDRFGSIGVMTSAINMRPMWEKSGVVFHDILATSSTAKNAEYFEVMAGNYDNYRTEFLDPLCEQFTGLVLSTRQNLVATEDNLVLNGKTFFATESQKYGLIDGVKSTQEVISELTVQAAKFYAQNNQLFTC